MSGPLHTITVAEAGRRFRARLLSPVELTQAYLARIEELDPVLNAFIEVTASRALAEGRVLALGHAYEVANAGARRRPELAKAMARAGDAGQLAAAG